MIHRAWLPLILTTVPLASAEAARCYGDRAEIYDGFDDLVNRRPDLVERIEIGSTVDGDKIWAWRVAHRATNERFSSDSGVLVMTAAVHGNEYRTPEMLYRFAWLLVNNYERSDQITWIVDTTEIWFVPIANPDGFGTSWRYNANDVDIARNFAFEWDVNTLKAGPFAASEPETRAIQQLLDQVAPPRDGDWVSPNQRGVYIDVHEAASVTMHAYSWSLHVPHCELAWINGHFARENGTRAIPNAYLYGTGCNVPSYYHGSPVDYAYGARGIPAFTFELKVEKYPCTTQSPHRFAPEECAAEAATLYDENVGAWLLAAQMSRAPYLYADGPFYQPGTIRQRNGRIYARFSTYATEAEHPPRGCDHQVQPIVAATFSVYERPSPGVWTPLPNCANLPMVARDGAFDSDDEWAEGNVPAACAGGDYIVLQGRTPDYFGPEVVFNY